MSEQKSKATSWVLVEAKCDACGNCVAICPTKALGVGKVAYMVEENNCCRESCRICEKQCQEDAIRAY